MCSHFTIKWIMASSQSSATANFAPPDREAGADAGASGEKKEKKPRPPPPPPPPALATAALLVRGAAAKVLGLRPGTSGGELQALWVTEPGCAKVTINLDGTALAPFPKDELHSHLIDAIEGAAKGLTASSTPISLFDSTRSETESKYGTAAFEGGVGKPDQTQLRLAYIPGLLLTEVSLNWSLCATSSSCGAITFHKAVDPSSKKKPETLILWKKKQMTIRFEVACPDAPAAEPGSGVQPTSEEVKALDVAKVSVEVPALTGGAAPAAAASSPAGDSKAGAAAQAVEEGEPASGEMVVDPWEVVGKIDYRKLVDQFGSTEISPELLKRIERLTVGRGNVKALHPWLRRGIFFSHRDMDTICKLVEEGKPFYLYTGRGPSSLAMHLGHLVPFMMTKWLQDAFNVPLVIQMTDDEKFLWKGGWDPETGDNLMMWRHFTTENAKDIIAVGFDQKKTFLFSDLEYVGHMYPNIVRIWKAITYNTARGAFGFQGESNIGQSAFPAIQAAPSFPSSFAIPLGNDTMACLIPCAIDQDPYFRVTRDIAHKLVPAAHPLKGKPALIHAKFFPPLQGAAGKMSASDDSSAIFLTDSAEIISSKIQKHAFSGGRVTAKEQKELGADLDVDVSYQWLRFFLDDDAELEKIGKEYGTGQGEYWNTGSVKNRLIKELQELVGAHQERRAKVTDEVVAEWMKVRKLEF